MLFSLLFNDIKCTFKCNFHGMNGHIRNEMMVELMDYHIMRILWIKIL